MTYTVTDSLEALAVDAARDLEDAQRRGDRPLGGRHVRRPVRRHRVDGRRRAVAPRRSGVPGVNVLFLDTGYHFAETIGTRDAVAATTRSNVETVTHPLRGRRARGRVRQLYESDPDLCCAIRKVWPLDRALRTVRRLGRRHSPRRRSVARRHTPVVAWDAQRQQGQDQPARPWTDEQVDAYIAEHDILVNPLREIGYSLHRLRAVHPAGRRR